MLLTFAYTSTVSAQSITEIITDYEGYWKSSSTSINSIKPNNSHNLLSFSFNGVRYSTGVNDALLTSNLETFVAGDYRSLPVQSVNGTINSNTKVGVGAMYDGVPSGPSVPPPANNIPYYLTDGVKGLNIGTCIANLPAGNLFFSVGNVNPASIGDGVPDVVITQTADPSSGSFDRYEFSDVNGTRVGNYKDIILTSISPVGNWLADFYEASTTPLTLQAGFTNTERAIRLWAADFSEFGITSADIGHIAYFKITLNGNSDVAFVGYNHNAINFSTMLPIQLSSFTASGTKNGNELTWETRSEATSDHFDIETSRDGVHFVKLGEKKAMGFSSTLQTYSYTHNATAAGTYYYRLKQVDIDGKFTYSKIVQADIHEAATYTIYPNPATDHFVLRHKLASGHETVQIATSRGTAVHQTKLTKGSSQTTISQLNLGKGMYFVTIIDGMQQITRPLLIR